MNAEFEVTAVLIAALIVSGVALVVNVTANVAPFKVMLTAVVAVPKFAFVQTAETTSESLILVPSAGAVNATVAVGCPVAAAISWWCRWFTPNASIT